jgi:hypothetical protein
MTDRLAREATGATRSHLDTTSEDTLTCAHCGVALMPAEPLLYLLGAKEGFVFFHATGACAEGVQDAVR